MSCWMGSLVGRWDDGMECGMEWAVTSRWVVMGEGGGGRGVQERAVTEVGQVEFVAGYRE